MLNSLSLSDTKTSKCKSEISLSLPNISISLRTKDFDVAKDSFVCGGKITLNELKYICEESVENIKEKIKFLPNSEIISLAFNAYIKKLPFSEFENEVNSYIVNYLTKRKYETSGYIPFALYCYYKINEIQNVRIIMVGLNNGINKSEIERRLLKTYEG